MILLTIGTYTIPTYGQMYGAKRSCISHGHETIIHLIVVKHNISNYY